LTVAGPRLSAAEAAEAFATWAGGLVDPVCLLDVGCRGGHPTWRELAPVLDYVGCDPLAVGDEEGPLPRTRRLRTRRCAVAANPGEATLHVTADPDCSSLLRPNWPVLERYNYAWRFEVVAERSVECATLDALAAEHGDFDVVKLDSQGLEYQLVSSGIGVISRALCVEIEAGLIENYVGEYPLALIDPLLRQAGFALVELKPLWSSRRGWKELPTRHQPLWCETVWLRDFVGGGGPLEPPAVAKLALFCKLLGQFAFGQELLAEAARGGVVPSSLADAAREPRFWQLPWTLPVEDGELVVGAPEL
jgi:FkbM family methyltransferase